MKFITIITILALTAISHNYTYASSIQINGDRIIIINDDGTKIDTNDLKNEVNIKNGNSGINENGISIGTTNNKDDKGIHKTTLDNVVIINNGKTQIYKNKDDKEK